MRLLVRAWGVERAWVEMITSDRNDAPGERRRYVLQPGQRPLVAFEERGWPLWMLRRLYAPWVLTERP